MNEQQREAQITKLQARIQHASYELAKIAAGRGDEDAGKKGAEEKPHVIEKWRCVVCPWNPCNVSIEMPEGNSKFKIESLCVGRDPEWKRIS